MASFDHTIVGYVPLSHGESMRTSSHIPINFVRVLYPSDSTTTNCELECLEALQPNGSLDMIALGTKLNFQNIVVVRHDDVYYASGIKTLDSQALQKFVEDKDHIRVAELSACLSDAPEGTTKLVDEALLRRYRREVVEACALILDPTGSLFTELQLKSFAPHRLV